jgi:hypothetical protein
MQMISSGFMDVLFAGLGATVTHRIRYCSCRLGFSEMGGSSKIRELREPEKVPAERLRNLKLILAGCVTLLNADGNFNVTFGRAECGGGQEVAILQAGKLVEGAILQDASKRNILATRHTKLELAAPLCERNSDSTEEISVAFIGRKKLRHSVVIIAHIAV